MKKIWKPLLIIILIIVAFVIYKGYKAKLNKPEWKLEQVEKGSIREVVTASGTINPVMSVEVGTEVSGTIEKIYKDFNQTVKKGDLLAKIDTETLELNLEEVKSNLAVAESSARDAKIDYDLLKELVTKKMAAEYDLQKAEIKLDQAKEAVTRAKLSYQKAKKNLDNAYIYSPIDGVIVSRDVEEGQTVAASLNAPTLFVIANNLKEMQIDASVDEADIGKINLNMPVRFTVDAFSEESFRGKVQQVRLNPTNESNVITYTVIISISNPDMLLLPGMTANVRIIVNEREDVLTVSSRALQFKPSKEVWESFGLVWNDSLLFRGRNRGMSNMTGSSGSNTPQTQNKENSNNQTAKKVVSENQEKPRMSREDFEKMSPEQKAKFREEMKKRRSEKENVSESSTSTTGQNTSVDIYKLRGTYLSSRVQTGRIWVLENNIPKSIMVETGISDGNKVEILSGLKEGQQIISGVNSKDSETSTKTSGMMPMGGMGPR